MIHLIEPSYENSRKQFVAFYHFNGWTNINLGLSLSVKMPNVEIHVPFGFFRIGWEWVGRTAPINQAQVATLQHGLKPRYN